LACGEPRASRPPQPKATALHGRGASSPRRKGQTAGPKAAGGGGIAGDARDWYREKVAAKYDGSRARAAAGRPRSPDDRVGQLLTMARENPSWGYTRLRGALKNVGLELGRSTIARILKEQGIEPAPIRGKTMPWKTFLKAHWGAIAAADFFSVEVLTVGGLVRYLVLFVIDLKTRRVHVAGITCRVDGEWMAQIARNLTDSVAGPLSGFVYLIVDRDPLYTAQFKSVLASAGVKLLRLPACSPNLNAFAERFVRSIKEECLRRIVPLGEGHLRRTIEEFVAHYHSERNHQGICNVIPFPARGSPATGAIRRRERLGGLLYSMNEPPREPPDRLLGPYGVRAGFLVGSFARPKGRTSPELLEMTGRFPGGVSPLAGKPGKQRLCHPTGAVRSPRRDTGRSARPS
ncbi:MAG: integrase core domain-containing protein, partial [Myxococcota bacterium]|nr:integrase core domain-containing protein [Myxococcota bacterium]